MRKFIKKKLSIIIPTYNEVDNIKNIINELIIQLQHIDFEIIIVDDGSTDNTVESIFSNFKNNNNIKVIQREFDRGLLQSIKFALQSITGEKFVIMDGDGQHSPKDIKPLIQELDKSDLVIGSRDLKNLDSMTGTRIFLSKIFNMLVSIVLSTRISDPLTGFFAGRVNLLNKKFFLLSNSGFKVLLDLIFSNRSNKISITEKIIDFHYRKAGSSKLGPQVMFSFMTQIFSYIFNGLISSKLIGFLLIGGFGFLIHFGILILCINSFEISFILSHTIATLTSATINFLLNNYLNFYNSQINTFSDILKSLFKYYLINIPGILSSIGGASFAYNVLLKNPFISSIIGVFLDTIFKYFISKSWIWKSR